MRTGVREMSRQVAAEMLSMNGFIGWVGVTIADRMLTITAWENAGDSGQLMEGGRHAEAMTKFFGPELGAGGYTAVFAADHVNATWVRCTSCQDRKRASGKTSGVKTSPTARRERNGV